MTHDHPEEPETRPGTLRPIVADDAVAGFLVANPSGWRFRAADARFRTLDCARFARCEDALCAARGVVALRTADCRCRARIAVRPALAPAELERLSVLGSLDGLLERDAA